MEARREKKKATVDDSYFMVPLFGAETEGMLPKMPIAKPSAMDGCQAHDQDLAPPKTKRIRARKRASPVSGVETPKKEASEGFEEGKFVGFTLFIFF